MDNATQSHILQLQEAMKQNRLVVFVGAGASASVGVPTWPKLIQSFKSELPKEMYDEGDALKTAEAYRELRGDAEYLTHIKKVLRYGETSCGPVHDAIMNLNPCHIITTNYDDLLEQAAIQNHKQYSVVAKDEDLSLNKGERMIIKMHGDFANNNIVLTENDYYDYRRNFPLINSFLMSLFATQVVLFIGFSFNDINLKFILRQVHNALGDKMQRVYLLTDEKKDALAHSYFKNKSVQLLSITEEDASSIVKDQLIEVGDVKALHERTKALYYALCIIKHFDFYFESIVDKSVNALSLYQDQINFWGKQVQRLLNSTSAPWIRVEETGIKITRDIYKAKFKKLLELKSSEPEQNKIYEEKIGWLKRKLVENGIETVDNVRLYSDEEREKWDAERKENAIDLFYRMSLKEVENRMQYLSHRTLTYTIDDLELPFLQYRLGMYNEAFQAYKRLAPEMWKRRKYMLYFICLYNLHASLGRAFMQMSFRKDANMQEWNYVQSVHLEDILAELPIEKNVKEIFEDLVSGVQLKNLLISSSELSEKLSTQKKSAERGGMSINSNIVLLLNEYGQAFNFCNENFILTDTSQNTKNAFIKIGEGIVNSVLTPSDKNQLQSKISLLPEMAVELYVFMLEPANLVKVLGLGNGEKIPAEEGFKMRLQEIVRNIAKDLKENPNERLLKSDLAINYISNIVLLQYIIKDSVDLPELYEVLAAYWGNGMHIDNFIISLLPLTIELQKPSPADALALLMSLSQTRSFREANDANLICVLANIVHEGGLMFDDFPGVKYISSYQGVECIASYYHALSSDEQNDVVSYVRKNTKDLFELFRIETHTEAHFITADLLMKLASTVKKNKTYLDPEGFASYMLVQMLHDERYKDLHDSIQMLSKRSDVLRFLCEPNQFPKGEIKAQWLKYLSDDDMKKLYADKAIRKMAIEYAEKHKEEDKYLIKKLLQFEKE